MLILHLSMKTCNTMKKLFSILAIGLAACAAFTSCNKDDSDEITNTLTYKGTVYNIDLAGYVSEEGTFDCDIHFLEDTELSQAWAMMWAVGKIGTYQLPAAEEDFMMTKNVYLDYDISFKSGTAKAWLDGENLCLVVDGVLVDGATFKLSARSSNY